MEIHPSFWSNLLSGAFHFDAHKWDHVVAAGVVFLVILIMGLLIKSRVSLVPGHLQQVNEVVVSGLLGLLDDSIGEHSRKYLPLIGTLGFFIFLSNLSGMIPGFSSATSNINTTIACAVIVFLYYNYQGLKEHGIGYLKHFMGPMPMIAPLMIPIEIISHLARPFSLSVRLFGNISGEHVVVGVFYMLCAPIIPVLVMPFGLFSSFLQAFVFVLLSTLYVAGSIAHDH
jgi:F-type H+-transporting ATPase subunit a